MMIVELESEEGRLRIWSEENGFYLLRDATRTSVQNFFRQQAIMRADTAFAELTRAAIDRGVQPLRQTKVVS